MIRTLILKRIAVEERHLGGSLDYARFIVKASVRAFLKFIKVTPMANHRSAVDVEAWHVARLLTTHREDCGECIGIETNLARKSGIADDTIRAVLEGRPDDLSPDLQDVYHFTDAVLTHMPSADPLRERLQARYGDRGLVDLAFGISAARLFPTTKRVLGFARGCDVPTP